MKKSLKIDYVSDLHLGFYLPYNDQIEFRKEDIKEFVFNHIVTNKNNNILVVAGDICESVDCVVMFLEECSKYYDKVFAVAGNHEYYMIGKLMLSKYSENSLKKIEKISEELSKNDKIIYLDRNNPYNNGFYNYEGFNIAGDTFWYLPKGIEDWTFYYINSNDSRLIYSDLSLEDKIRSLYVSSMRWYDNLPECDLIITHVPPMYNKKSPYGPNSCYYTRPGKLKAKVWIYGHDHITADFEELGTHFVSNPWGYKQKMFKIKTIEVTK